MLEFVQGATQANYVPHFTWKQHNKDICLLDKYSMSGLPHNILLCQASVRCDNLANYEVEYGT